MMGRVFDAYQQGQQGGMSRGMNMLSMEQMLDKKRRDTALRNALASAYTPAAPADMPYAEGVEPRQAGFNMENAFESMYQNNLAPEAFAMQMQMASADAPLKKVMLEHKLKQDMINSAFDRFGNFRGGNADPSMSMKIGPQGPEMTYDPSKGRKLRIDEAAHHFNTGQPIGGYSGGAPSTTPLTTGSTKLSPKANQEVQKLRRTEAIKAEQKRKTSLYEGRAGRSNTLGKMIKFRELIKSGEMRTGAGRQFAQEWLPGVYTKQGRLSEEFNALAETAARAALKAAGEIRPTDADVKGMKEAMFGVGRDEDVNAQLLDDAINQMMIDEREHQTYQGKPVGNQQYKLGDVITNKSGQRAWISGFTDDGRPLIKVIK